MGLFDLFKKHKKPYKQDSLNIMYELLFCDNVDLFKRNIKQKDIYPFDILLSDNPDQQDIERIINDETIESRYKILAYNKSMLNVNLVNKKELFAVIVEIGLDNGLDVLAAFKDGSARYINHSGKLIVFDTVDDTAKRLISKLFIDSEEVVKKIGPWDKPRKSFPRTGFVRITFLVSDGLYFGEGPIKVLFNDALAKPALESATVLMKYLLEK